MSNRQIKFLVKFSSHTVQGDGPEGWLIPASTHGQPSYMLSRLYKRPE